MKDLLKSYKTTIIGFVAIVGLIVHVILSEGFSVQDFLALVMGVGFIASKDADKSHSKSQKVGGQVPKNDDERP